MASDPWIGRTVLGKYRIDQIIGSGGMGTVYEAEDLRLGRPVAIKVLRPKGGSFGDVARRFRREARTIAQVTHPNLVTLLEFDLLDDQTPAMVMERIRGQSLRALMHHREFSAAETQEILRQALSALAACHEAGVVHRDLKPGNILLEDAGGELHVKIIDFGLTKIVAEDQSVLTAQGEVFGSPRFMAPEQWMSRDVDGRTDLYALGLIGYCLLQGQHFIRPGNPVEVCKAHIKQPRPVITHDQLGNPVPPALLEGLHRATQPRIERRFPDAQTMRTAICGHSGGLPASAAEGAQDATIAELPTPLPVSALGGAPDEAPTMLDPGLAAMVRAATDDPSGSVDSAPLPAPVSPQTTVRAVEAALERDESVQVDTDQVPHEVAEIIHAIPRADFEAALRATTEHTQPPRIRPPEEAAPAVIGAAATPSPPIERPAPVAPGDGHPARSLSEAPPAAPAEDELALKPWMLVVAGLVAAGTAALVVVLLQ